MCFFEIYSFTLHSAITTENVKWHTDREILKEVYPLVLPLHLESENFRVTLVATWYNYA